MKRSEGHEQNTANESLSGLEMLANRQPASHGLKACKQRLQLPVGGLGPSAATLRRSRLISSAASRPPVSGGAVGRLQHRRAHSAPVVSATSPNMSCRHFTRRPIQTPLNKSAAKRSFERTSKQR